MSDSLEIELEANLTIAQAEAFASQLEDASRKGVSVTFNGTNVERADTAGLQLILSFIKEMDALGLATSWSSVSDPLKNAAKLLGLESKIKL